ncbi:glycoside hydrolase family 18 protein [Thermothielavioides terrestris NRRL 8126]|uniref:chitinase n=1 Tax=Thermothielavioides terrestris (strain ATCC 38088 / NRRL 8126) TaxID=578455 RepID=G2RER9_THETT|nr:glycoside hydrolase family 18 protein [Thermothielavioides terrestris NRRL 8126]AEO70202.1 glycoside hydrolase family 18 protein [Thermothielavioides terrestris NRRL 8126]
MSSSSRKSRITSAAHVIYTNAVYWPNYRVYNGDTPGQLNYGCINRVYYAFANVMPDGGVLLSDEYADARAPCDGVQGALGSLMHLKARYPHLQVLLSIGGGESAETFPIVASNAVLRDNFARSARGLVEASGLDGIDIVWEYPCTPQQGNDFLALVAAIRIHLPEDRYLLTAALPAAKPILQNIDLQQTSAYLDTLNLTAYDFFGDWTHKSGHHAQLYAINKDEPSGASGAQYIMSSGVPGKKILLGIPLFGRSFLHVTGPGHKNRGSGGNDGSFEYSQLPRKGTKEQVDKRAVAAQCVGGDGGFVTYDNPDTVKGLFYWSAPSDAKDTKRSLVATGFKTLHSS